MRILHETELESANNNFHIIEHQLDQLNEKIRILERGYQVILTRLADDQLKGRGGTR